MQGLLVDVFCGGGGASKGIEQATGRPVDIAINHDLESIRMHWLNHPFTRHLTEDVWKSNPLTVTRGKEVLAVWLSPDCTDHSNAKGDKPRDNKRRCLADVGIVWAKTTKPWFIFLENVPEFEDWGPLNKNGRRDNTRKGQEFKRWVHELECEGYKVEWKRLRACDYGVPTSRERLFVVARRDGQPIVWPTPTHGDGLLPYRTAAECIDFSLPCPSIFLPKDEAWKKYRAKRPLAEKTLDRIAKGIQKFIIETKNPYIVDNKALFLSKYHGAFGGNTDGRGQSICDPLLTQDTQNRFAMVCAYLKKFYGTSIGIDLQSPLPTVTGQGQHLAMVYAFLMKYYGCGIGQSVNDSMHTLTGKDHMGLVLTIHNEQYQIVDIGLRMLTPVELMKAHGFPDDYVLVGTKSNQVARIGNSVPPKMAKVIVEANIPIEKLIQKAVG